MLLIPALEGISIAFAIRSVDPAQGISIAVVIHSVDPHPTNCTFQTNSITEKPSFWFTFAKL